MPQAKPKKPSQIARVLAVFALIGAFVLVIAVVATNGEGEGDDDNGTEQTEGTGSTKAGEQAVAKGVWVVQDGDTLVAISEKTGIDLDELVSLNPDIDPQALIAGQRISLRAGQAGDDDSSASSSGTTTNGDPADEFGDGSVANDDDSSSSSP